MNLGAVLAKGSPTVFINCLELVGYTIYNVGAQKLPNHTFCGPEYST